MEFQIVRNSCFKFVLPMKSVTSQAFVERRMIALRSVMVVLEQSSRTSVFVSAITSFLQIKSATQIAEKMLSKLHLLQRVQLEFMILLLKTQQKHRYQILSVKQSAQKKTPVNVNL